MVGFTFRIEMTGLGGLARSDESPHPAPPGHGRKASKTVGGAPGQNDGWLAREIEDRFLNEIRTVRCFFTFHEWSDEWSERAKHRAACHV